MKGMLLCLALAACGGPADESTSEGTVVEQIADPLATPKAGIQVVVDLDVPAKAEVEKCWVQSLPEEDSFAVREIAISLPTTMHHFAGIVVYGGMPSWVKPDVQYDCADLRGEDTFTLAQTLFTTQSFDLDVVFPENMAWKFPREFPLVLQAHYVNTLDQPVHVRGAMNLVTMEAADVETWINFFISSDEDLNIGPGDSIERSRCIFEEPTEVLVIGSHTHGLGSLFTIDRVNADKTTEPLYENDNWEIPPIMQFDPPLSFKEGEGFEFACHYTNSESNTVHYGPSSSDEMCIMAGLYYPDRGTLSCPAESVE